MKFSFFFICIFIFKSLIADDKFLSENYEVSSKPCNCENGYEMVVNNNTTNITSSIKNGTHYVTLVKEYKEKVIIIGEIDSNTKIVNILNKSDLKLVDSFYCFFPSVSTSGRYIVAELSAPSHGQKMSNDDLFLCYDLNKSPNENRLKEYDEKEIKFVGKPIFPEINYNSQTFSSDNILNRPPYMLRDEILWSIKNDICMFLVSNENDVKLVFCNFKDEIKDDFRTINFSEKVNKTLKEKETIELRQLRIDSLRYDEESGIVKIKTKYIESIKRAITIDLKIEYFDKFK